MNPTVVVAWIALYVGLVAVTMLKGKYWMGVIALLIGGPLVAIFGTSRLAKPDSWWAQRFYDEAKSARARERFGSPGRAEYVPPPIAEMFR